jgi:hypothetical protein
MACVVQHCKRLLPVTLHARSCGKARFKQARCVQSAQQLLTRQATKSVTAEPFLKPTEPWSRALVVTKSYYSAAMLIADSSQ